MIAIEVFVTLWKNGFPCLFHSISGLYCLGCGGTRSVKALIRGDLASSFRYHPLVLYAAAVFIIEILGWGLSKRLNRPELYIKRYEWFVYLGVAMVLLNWIVKNYYLIVKGIDLLML